MGPQSINVLRLEEGKLAGAVSQSCLVARYWPGAVNVVSDLLLFIIVIEY